MAEDNYESAYGAVNSKRITYTNEWEDNYIYISHLDEDYQYWKLPIWPDSVSDSMQSNFPSTSALGRSAPVFTYSNSGPRTVQINLNFHRDSFEDVNLKLPDSTRKKLGDGENYLDNMIHALQACVVPRYNLTNKAVEPPIVALRLGRDIYIKGVITSGIGLTFTKPILVGDVYAQVSLSLTISEIDPYTANEVFQNGSFRGLVSTISSGALAKLVG